ncbi:hypothetical protein RHS01_09742 [Rhizoctonia solani]|uniref:Uncharacterized protein n=1 Tax=Rhizoctonia solani TaxID=456999 RepID=A0A8H7I598_9AGAM|nr:hypothetical protein RHS01_09742 [Rhizoctonia solani]
MTVQDVPTSNSYEVHSTDDDLFENSTAHAQPTPNQHDAASDSEQWSELGEFDLDSDLEEEDGHAPSTSETPWRGYQTQPNSSANEWFPYASFAMYLADLLFSSRRLHFSREQMWLFWSLHAQQEWHHVPPQQNLGNAETGTLQIKDPGSKITYKHIQDFANPHLRPHMNFLPHIEGKHMSQAWHGYKMVHDVNNNVLTPCLKVRGRIYYVNELVRRKDDYFLPLRWITYGPSKKLYAIGYHTSESLVCGFLLVHSVPLIIFMDDASGNTSKQWNKHWSCYLSNAALPREVLQAEYNVRFVSTSPHATPLDLTHGIRSSIDNAFHNPAVAFDCLTQEEVLIWPFPLFWAGDNPMQAEHCSSSGLASNKFCQTCEVGGDTSFKQSIVGYRTLFEPGVTRSAAKTRQLIDERLNLALKPRMIQKVKDHISDSGIKDPIAQPLIDRLLVLGKNMVKGLVDGVRCSPEEVENALRVELATVRKTEYMNPLLGMEDLG